MTLIRWLLLSERVVPDGDEWLAPEECAQLARLRFAARRRDWRLGRWAAKCALCGGPDAPLQGRPACEVSVLPDAEGAPHVFCGGMLDPCVVSLSHREGWGLCAISDAGVRLGCDLERIEPRSDAFVRDYFTDRERELLLAATAVDRPRIANLVWSAKESAVKVLGTGWRVDTRSAEVELAPEEGSAGWRPLRVRCEGRAQPLEGWWRQELERIVTVVSAPALPPPVRIKSSSLPGLARPGRAPAA